MSQVCTGEKTQQVWRVAAWTAFIVAALHYGNLAHLVGAAGDEQAWTIEASSTSPFVFSDTRSYARQARSANTRGLLGIEVLNKPPGFPALLHASRHQTGTFFTILLLVPLLVAAAAAATVRLTWRATGSTRVAVLAGLLFALWPGQYQFAPVLLTDAMHANLAVVALCCSLEWFHSKRTGWGLAAGPLWMSTLWLRPTLIFLPALVAGYIMVRLIRRRSVHCLIWLNLVCCAVPPGYMLIQNIRRHNLPVVAAVGMENLAVWVVARTREEMGEGRFKDLRRTIGERYRQLDSAKQQYEAKKRDFVAFARAHPWPTAIGLVRETLDQALYPSRPYLRTEMHELYPAWMQITHNGMIAIWCFAGLGLGVLFRRAPALAVLLAACSCFVMGVASIAHLAGARLRLPVDLLLIPATALGLATTASWLWYGARRAARLLEHVARGPGSLPPT